MISYIVKLIVFVLFSLLITFFYFSAPGHSYNFDGYFVYVVLLGLCYGCYKYYSHYSNKNTYTPLEIGGYFCLHLFILALLFFYFQGDGLASSLGYGIGLFFKIMYFSILPSVIILISMAFGSKALHTIFDNFAVKRPVYKLIFSLGFGFFLFVFFLTVLGMLGMYNLFTVAGILGVCALVSIKELGKICSGIVSYQISSSRESGQLGKQAKSVDPKLLSMEFFFLVITGVLAINLISIFRPFPIGWDDLGVYMNYPSLMAASGYVGELGGMLSWQTFTGIGYMFGNPTLAFFMNNVGGFLSVIVIILILSDVLSQTKRCVPLHLPTFGAAVFISLPMIVFEQAKDMKLDPGLFFISIIALYIICDFFVSKGLDKKEIHNLEKENEGSLLSVISKKKFFPESLKLFMIVGMLVGFTFSIKFTSLLFIVAIIGVLFYTRLGLAGFISYVFLFISVFTLGDLWSRMNVVIANNDGQKDSIIYGFGIIGIMCLTYAGKKYIKNIGKFSKRLSALLLGIFIALSPWLIHNIYSSGEISVSSMLSGSPEKFEADYSLLHGEKEWEALKQTIENRGMTSSGTTTNEDFGRYFGYEEGLNNYVKLPWNLTMQVNQGGEFTNIGFLFLAFLPAIFLFLPYRRKEYALLIYGVIIFEILLFIIPVSSSLLTSIFASISLPYGYLVLLCGAFLSMWVLLSGLKKTYLTDILKVTLIFTSLYIFLWTISSFGVVWYGIVMYFSFILFIVIGFYYMLGYKAEESVQKSQVKLVASSCVYVILGIYFTFFIIPYSFNNLKTAAYSEYKKGDQTTFQAPFLYHREYLPILFNLNISEEKQKKFLDTHITNKQIQKYLEVNTAYENIGKIQAVLIGLQQSNQIDQKIKIQAQQSLDKVYKGILHPTEEFKNTQGIYRIGTFLKYHISENNKRLLEDSLVDKFDKYVYSTSPDTTVHNLKKLGINYLLVDLNAATIDKAPEKDLTRRYENLLRTFSSQNLELVDTDSVCLKLGLDKYKKSGSIDEFLAYGGVNYNSYNAQGIAGKKRTDKLISCYTEIVKIFKNNNLQKYTYLAPYLPALQQISSDDEKVKYLHSKLGHGYKVLFKIK